MTAAVTTWIITVVRVINQENHQLGCHDSQPVKITLAGAMRSVCSSCAHNTDDHDEAELDAWPAPV